MSGLLEKLGCSALECRSSLVLICNFKWVNLNCVAIDCLGNLGVLLIVWELIHFGNLEAIVYILSVTIVIIIIKLCWVSYMNSILLFQPILAKSQDRLHSRNRVSKFMCRYDKSFIPGLSTRRNLLFYLGFYLSYKFYFAYK